MIYDLTFLCVSVLVFDCVVYFFPPLKYVKFFNNTAILHTIEIRLCIRSMSSIFFLKGHQCTNTM